MPKWSQKLIKTEKGENKIFEGPPEPYAHFSGSKGAKTAPKSRPKNVQIMDRDFDGFWHHFAPPNVAQMTQK